MVIIVVLCGPKCGGDSTAWYVGAIAVANTGTRVDVLAEICVGAVFDLTIYGFLEI